MSAREIIEAVVQFRVTLDQDEMVEEELGLQALLVAREIETALAERFGEDDAHAELWEQFLDAPRLKAPDLAAALEPLLRNEPELARRLDDLLASFYRAKWLGPYDVDTGADDSVDLVGVEEEPLDLDESPFGEGAFVTGDLIIDNIRRIEIPGGDEEANLPEWLRELEAEEPAEPGRLEDLEEWAWDEPEWLADLNGEEMAGPEEEMAAPEEMAGPEEQPSARYLNAGFFADEEPVPEEDPLSLEGGPYRLGVNVGAFWGPGSRDAPIPDDLLEPYFEEEEELEMDVVARSLDVTITPEQQTLQLPRQGDAAMIFFDLAFARTGRQAIDVDLLFRGHLLQSRRVEIEVVDHARVELPPSASPVQDGYVTFTRTAVLDEEALEPLRESPRMLTIVAERDLDFNRIVLRFYDGTGADLGFLQSTLSDASLTRALTAVRGQLVSTMRAYTGFVGSSEEVLAKHLGLLAAVGRKFYLALLPGLDDPDDLADEGQRLDVRLEARDVVQVAPLSTQLSVPWELLYERKVESYHEGRTTLCPTFRDHGPAPEDCPSHGDPSVVCPHGFWGYRYIIEQLPCRVDPHQSARRTMLPLEIRNGIPSRVAAGFSTRLHRLDEHRDGLRELAPRTRLEIVEAASLEDVKAALLEQEQPADVIYFYAHGGSDDFGSPYLEVGQSDRIHLIDLDAWDVALDDHRPLVVLNACESADYAPDDFENLIKFFCDAGAAGVIGTQCEVKEKLVHALTLSFFRTFFGRTSAGEALFEARRALLGDHLDPRGLTYSLFAAADVRLAQSITA